MFFEEFTEEVIVVGWRIGAKSRQVMKLVVIVAESWEDDAVGKEFNH